MALIN